jgi:hypothetical protein
MIEQSYDYKYNYCFIVFDLFSPNDNIQLFRSH